MARNRNYKVFIWTFIILLIDQASKLFIVLNVPLNQYHRPFASFFNGYLRIIHVRNPAIAFSIGSNLPEGVRTALFIVLPIAVLSYVAFLILRDPYLKPVQRNCLAVILGGGLGNMIDRIFRPGGVVDFVDTDFWDINIRWGAIQWSMQRWPTYNVADASVLVGMTILILYTLFFISKKEREKMWTKL